MYIVFEGPDKVGKTTLIQNLFQYFQSNCPTLNDKGESKFEIIKFPNRTTSIGTLIDQYLNEKLCFDKDTMALLSCANKHEIMNLKKNESIDEKNKIYLIDRYIYSGIVYSLLDGAKLDWCIDVNSELPKPDIIIYLNPDEEFMKQQLNYIENKEKYENFDILKKINKLYRDMFINKTKYKKLFNDNCKIIIIDINMETNEKTIVEIVLKHLEGLLSL